MFVFVTIVANMVYAHSGGTVKSSQVFFILNGDDNLVWMLYIK